MPITVKHDAPVAPLADIAYLSGKKTGNRQRDVQDRDYLLKRQRLDQQQQQFDKRLEFRNEDREDQQEAILERMRTGAELDQQAAQFKNELKKENIDYAYTSKQKAAFQKLSEQEAVLQSDPESLGFRPEEVPAALAQIRRKMLGITEAPQASLHDKQPTVADQFEAETVTKDGIVYGRDKDGQLKKLGESNEYLTNRDLRDMYETAYEMLTVETADSDGNKTIKHPSPEETRAKVKEMLQIRQEVMPTEAEAPAGQPSAGSAPPSQGPQFDTELGIKPPDLSGVDDALRDDVAEKWNTESAKLKELARRHQVTRQRYDEKVEEYKGLQDELSRKNIKPGMQEWRAAGRQLRLMERQRLKLESRLEHLSEQAESRVKRLKKIREEPTTTALFN